MTSEKMIADCAVSSRVRLARNIEGMPFPWKLKDDRKSELARAAHSELAKHGNYKLSVLNELNPIEAEALKEKRLISRELLENKEAGAVILNADETLSIMINEEDHIRAQGILRGSALKEAYNIVSMADDKLSEKFKFSFSTELGYITCCPTNLGTGMRASVMLFLPALTLNRHISELVNSASKLRLTIRGHYGEGTEASGYMYQVSNQVTLGIEEAEILRSVSEAIQVISIREFEERQKLLSMDYALHKDRIMRAWGTLTNAYKISSEEFIACMSDVKLGASLGLIENLDTDALNDLLILAQPANLVKAFGKPINADERDIYRAEFVADNLRLIKNGG